MQTPSTIVILSSNQDFTDSIAPLVAREFSAICKIVTSEDDRHILPADLIIADKSPQRNFPVPMIIAKFPIVLRELFVEVERRIKLANQKNEVKIGDNLQLSIRGRFLQKIGKEARIDLTEKEIELLIAINSAGETGISKEELLKKIWDMTTPLDTHTLETHIYRLRKKIRDGLDMEIISFEGGVYRV